MAVVVTDMQGGKHVLIDKRARPQGKASQSHSHSLPRERFPLPLAGDLQSWWQGRSSLAHAIDKLWGRISSGLTQDDMYHESLQLAWSWGSRGVQYVILHLPQLGSHEKCQHYTLPLTKACHVWFAADKVFERDLLQRVSAAIDALIPSHDLCAMLNCRTPTGLITSVIQEEETQVTQAAAGQHPVVRLVRTASAARQALTDIRLTFATTS